MVRRDFAGFMVVQVLEKHFLGFRQFLGFYCCVLGMFERFEAAAADRSFPASTAAEAVTSRM